MRPYNSRPRAAVLHIGALGTLLQAPLGDARDRSGQVPRLRRVNPRFALRAEFTQSGTGIPRSARNDRFGGRCARSGAKWAHLDAPLQEARGAWRLPLTLTLVLSLRGRGVGPGLCDRLLSTALPGMAALPDAGETPIRQAPLGDAPLDVARDKRDRQGRLCAPWDGLASRAGEA